MVERSKNVVDGGRRDDGGGGAGIQIHKEMGVKRCSVESPDSRR